MKWVKRFVKGFNRFLKEFMKAMEKYEKDCYKAGVIPFYGLGPSDTTMFPMFIKIYKPKKKRARKKVKK